MKFVWIPLLLAPCAFAGPVAPLGTVTYEQIRAGTLLRPAAICPEIGKQYEEWVDKLKALKDSIRKEAKCANEQSKVDGFAKIVEDGRGPFLDLIRKGEAQSLTKDDMDKLSGYVEKITKAGGTVADLISGGGCFRDDKENMMSVELIASLIGESTAALAQFIPSYGPLIAITGKVTSSLLVSLDKVIKARQNYDFNDADQRKAFVKTMCSYDSMRADIDQITRLDRAIEDMQDYQLANREQLKVLITGCPECKVLYETYKKAAVAGEDFAFGSISSLLSKYKDEVKKIDDVYLLALGSQTIINARTQIFAQSQLDRLNLNVSDIGDIERDRVAQLQDSIEEFIYVKWLPQFVRFYSLEANARYYELTQYLYAEARRLGDLSPWRMATPAQLTIVFTNIGGDIVERRAVQGEANRRISNLVSTISTLEKTCRFARAAEMKYGRELHDACETKTIPMLEPIYLTLLRMSQTTHARSATLKSLYEVPGPILEVIAKKNAIALENKFIWKANWIQSLTALMRQLLDKPAELFVRK